MNKDSKLRDIVYNEFVAGQGAGDFAMIGIGLLLQIAAFAIAKGDWLSLVTGLLGVFSVVLCSQKKISTFVFAVLQISCYMVLAARQHFYGELIENVFYMATTLYGAYVWFRHYNTGNEGNAVETQRLSAKGWILSATLIVAGSVVAYLILKQTNDTQPLLDSISTVPAFAAQILMMLRYREQWIFWIVVEVASIIMWVRAGDWCMAVLFAFWIATCLYGLKKWA